METTQVPKISKEMIISEILVANQDKASILAEIMLDFGIHCIGCGAASFETLEQGVLGHGFSESELDKLVETLNKAVEGSNKEVKDIQEFKLNITDSAIKKIKESIEGSDTGDTLRVSVVAGGCSGFMYNLEFVKVPSANDLNFKEQDVKIAVGKDSLEFLNGAEIDFVDTLNESGFKFNNPNSSAGCGCGKSFN